MSFGIELEEKNRKDAIPFQHFLTFRGHIINLCRRIQLLAGEKIDDETARRVFPSFVWLLRDVVLHLPKGIENLKKYFLEKVMFENAVLILVAFSEFLLYHDGINIYYRPSAGSKWLDIVQVLFCVFMNRDDVEVPKNAKRELGQYPAILAELAWLIKDLLYGIKNTEKSDLRTCLFTSTEKGASYMQK